MRISVSIGLAAGLLAAALMSSSMSVRAQAPTAPPPAALPATVTADQFRALPPDQKIAAISSLQFLQCILAAPSFLTLDFTKEIGITRHKTSTPEEQRFIDSTTKSQLRTRATSCRVTYPGADLTLVQSGIQPILRFRDKNATIGPVGDRYEASIKIGVDTFKFWAAKTRLRGAEAVVLELLRR